MWSLREGTMFPITGSKEFAGLGSIWLLLTCGRRLMFTEVLYALGPLHVISFKFQTNVQGRYFRVEEIEVHRVLTGLPKVI